jgi:nucleoside-diphosphate-sugar epimerase
MGEWRRGSDGVHYMVLPELAALGHPIEMPSDDSESDWIYAADAAEAWWRAMITPAPPRPDYNLAAERAGWRT